MKNKYKLFGLYLPLFLVAVISTVVMRTVALFSDFNVQTGFFAEKTLITVADIMVVAFSFIFLSYIFTARRDFKMIPDFTSPLTYPPTGIVAAALVFVGINFFKKAGASLEKINKLKDSIYLSERAEIGTERILLILAIVIALLALVSVANFALCALIEKGTSFERGNLGIVTVIFLALYSIYLYFDNDLPINAPAKIIDQMAYLFAAVFFLYETRLSIGREKWRGYIAFGFIAALISAYSSIPALIYFFAKETEISVSIYEMVLSAALFIFISSRMLLTSELIEDVVSPFTNIIAKASDQRTSDIAPVAKIEDITEAEDETIDENQLTIDDVCVGGARKESESDEKSDDASEKTDASISASESKETDDASYPADESDSSQITIDTDAENADKNGEADAEDKTEDFAESSDVSGNADAENATDSGAADAEDKAEGSAESSDASGNADAEDATDSGAADAEDKAEDSAESSDVSGNTDGESKNNEEKKAGESDSADK